MAAVPDYFRSVFINCPFDYEYRPLFHALVFAVADCGLVPRCALEAEDSSDVRIQKIMRIIEECGYGIHDISRTETSSFTEPDGSTEHLPRFNMPLELGLFIGAQRFGSERQKRKQYLVFDTKQYRYQKFVSDLAGQDIKAHHWHSVDSDDNHERAIAKIIAGIRNWLNPKFDNKLLPAGPLVTKRFKQFRDELPALTTEFGQNEADLTFYDLISLMQSWLQANPHK